MFEITTKGQTVGYSPTQLLTQLVGKMHSQEANPAQLAMIEETIRKLSVNLDKTTPSQIVDISFRLGYLFRLTLERNDVVYRSPDLDTTDSKGDSK